MGRVVGIEPTNTGTTIRGLNHLATPAIKRLEIIKQKQIYFKKNAKILDFVQKTRIFLKSMLIWKYKFSDNSNL